MTNQRKSLGNWGEGLATTHLEALGYSIRDRNWRCTIGEIDLVAEERQEKREKRVHFVEVKTRKGRSKGSPEESITWHKRNKLIQTALMYISTHQLGDVDWQIDLVAIELDRAGKLLRCELVENIVQGG